jgi:hypothetical protein
MHQASPFWDNFSTASAALRHHLLLTNHSTHPKDIGPLWHQVCCAFGTGAQLEGGMAPSNANKHSVRGVRQLPAGAKLQLPLSNARFHSVVCITRDIRCMSKSGVLASATH